MKWKVSLLLAVITAVPSVFAANSKYDSADIKPRRLSTNSPWFYVSEDDISLQESYSGFDPQKKKRFSRLTIADKALEMIKNADKMILASVFLFDAVYSDRKPDRDVVKEFTDLLISKKKSNPSITVVIVLDPINRGYGRRISPAVKRLVKNGVDVFYSDLISTKSATALGITEIVRDSLRVLDRFSFGVLGRVLSFVAGPRIPVKNHLDEDGLSIESLWNMTALKANHRKLLVTDSGDTYEALVSSANPHNASVGSTNFSVSVKGEPAKYIYMVIREDVIFSKKLGYVVWGNRAKGYKKRFLTDTLAEIFPENIHTGVKSKSTPVAVSFMTESRIRDHVIEMLRQVRGNDRIRIQMFYLSESTIIEAIIDAAGRVKEPIRIILDPNKYAFGRKKDGTPNRQVAAFLMQKKEELGLNLDIRWYDTYGEQNHAKIMTITGCQADEPKYELINGSANWTGKNLKDINLEANIRISGSKKTVTRFNELFDLFWENSDGMIYTVDYRGKYQAHTGMRKWLDGERWGYVSW